MGEGDIISGLGTYWEALTWSFLSNFAIGAYSYSWYLGAIKVPINLY